MGKDLVLYKDGDYFIIRKNRVGAYDSVISIIDMRNLRMSGDMYIETDRIIITKKGLDYLMSKQYNIKVVE